MDHDIWRTRIVLASVRASLSADLRAAARKGEGWVGSVFGAEDPFRVGERQGANGVGQTPWLSIGVRGSAERAGVPTPCRARSGHVAGRRAVVSEPEPDWSPPTPIVWTATRWGNADTSPPWMISSAVLSSRIKSVVVVARIAAGRHVGRGVRRLATAFGLTTLSAFDWQIRSSDLQASLAVLLDPGQCWRVRMLA